MPKRKSATTKATKAKKVAKVSNKKIEHNDKCDKSIISEIVNSDIVKQIEDDSEIDLVEELNPREVIDSYNTREDSKKEEYTHSKSLPDLGGNKNDEIFEKLVDATEYPSDDEDKHKIDGEGFPTNSRKVNPSSPKKGPQSPPLPPQIQDQKIKYDAAFITSLIKKPVDEAEKNGGAAYASDIPVSIRRDRESHEKRHVYTPPRGNFQSNYHNHQHMRGASNRGRFHQRGNFNQHMFQSGPEFPPFYPMHPQFPNPNFGGEFYPFPPPPMFPYPDGTMPPPHPPQYGYPADGFVDPAWYFPQQNFRGGGHGQPPFPRGNGRGRGERHGQRDNYFHPRRGGY